MPRRPNLPAALVAHGRTIAEPRLSPTGDRVAFAATVAGRGQLVVVPPAGGAEVVVTADPPPVPARAYGGGVFTWTADGAALVYAAGDGNLWVVPAEGGASSRLTSLPAGSAAAAPAVSPDGTRVAFSVDQAAIAVTPLDPSAGWPVRLSDGADFCFDPAWSPDSSTVAWHEWDVPHMPWDAGRIVTRAADASAPKRIVAGGESLQVQQPRFGPSAEIAHLSDATGWLNLWVGGRHLVDEPHEHGDPSWGEGQASFAWSPDGSRVAFCRNEGFGRLCMVDVATGVVSELGRGIHGSLSWQGSRLAALRSGGVTPNQIVVYDTASGERTVVARGPLGGWEPALREPELVQHDADDGATLHARLYRPDPDRALGDPPPLIVWIHGGPTGQWPVTFLPRVSFFVDRGWAVLVADHRGSTGHGRAYAQALNGRWGELDTADVAAAIRAAIDRGWGDAARVVVMGGSAGGFTVLNLLAHHPELCAAGVDLFGVADLMHLEETTHRFERHYLWRIVGPLPEAVATYRARAPLAVADQITAPLLVLQGTQDRVVPPEQSQAIVERLRELGRAVEFRLYEGEGHGWNRPETVMDELTTIEAFLGRHVLRRRPPSPQRPGNGERA